MKRHLFVIVAVTVAVGCSASLDSSGGSSGSNPEAELAAFAARSEYPTTRASTTQPVRTVPVSVVIDRKSGKVTLANASDEMLNDVKVWVNGTFVTPLKELPGHGTVTLTPKQFYNRNGRSLASAKTQVMRVDLQVGNELVRVQGPAFQ